MNDEEIEQFMELLKDYMIKSEIEIIKWKQRQEYYKGLAQHGDYLETVSYTHLTLPTSNGV